MAKKKQAEEPVSQRETQFAALKAQYKEIDRETKPAQVPRDLVMPSMCISMDLLTNEAGLRPASIVEYYGLPGVTKTRTALQMVRQAQLWAPDKSVAIVDTEGDVDLYAAKNTFDIDFSALPDGTPRVNYWPDPEFDDIPNLEFILNRIHDFAASGLFSLIVLDSVAMCMPLWEAKNEDITGTKFGGPALALSTGFRKIKAVAKRTGTRIWLVNQIRTKVIQTPHGSISKDEPGGGYALKFAASHRFKASWVKKAKEDDEYAMLRITGEKVKFGPSDRYADIPVLNGLIDRDADLVQVSARFGVIEKKGAWYYYDGSPLGNGLAQAASALRNHPDTLYAKIYEKTIAIANPVMETVELSEQINDEPEETEAPNE